MTRSFKLYIFMAAMLSAVVLVGAARILVKWTSGEPFNRYFSEQIAAHVQKELALSSDPLNLEAFQKNLEKTVNYLRPDDMLVFSDEVLPADDTAARLQYLSIHQQDWQPLSIQPIVTASIYSQEKEWRVLRVLHDSQQIYVCVQSAAFQKPLEQILAVRTEVTVKMLPALFLFVVLTTMFIIYSALKPIQTLQAAFADIKLTNPNSFINVRQSFREFDVFVKYFNELIERLRVNYEQAARFSSDAAHELRTPLTIIRGNLHRLINQAEDGTPRQLELTVVAEEVERLISISNKLLFLSQADAGHLGLVKKDIVINDLIQPLLEDAASFHPDLHFNTQVSEHLVIKADQDLMFQLMNNLLGNAVKYNQAHGTVSFQAQVLKGQLNFKFINTTQLKLSGLTHRVFERFYRHRELENHQVSNVSGVGLGLSLCQEIVKAHGGKLDFYVTRDQLVCVECTLPLA